MDQARDKLEICNLLLAEPDLAAKVINDMPRLEWLQSTWAGVTPLMHKSLRKDYLLTGVKGIFGSLISEYVFAYILMFEKNVLAHLDAQKSNLWHPVLPGHLSDKTLGIMGTGSIASAIAKTGKHFQMKVKGLNRSGKLASSFDEIYQIDELTNFLQQVDYLVTSLPDTNETQKLLNEQSLKSLKPECIFINVGRGSVVDEKALANALMARELKGAVLDVFEKEPLPQTNPLWTSPNTFITSHTAGPSFPEDVANIFSINYKRFLRTEPLNYLIDFSRGY